MNRRCALSRALLFALPLLLLFALTAQAGTMAPLNPAFVDYLAERAAEEAKGADSSIASKEVTQRGRTPSPVDLSHLAGKSYFDVKAAGGAAYPESYDLRPEGFVTPVRDQNPYGSCWTFSALASLESSALRSGVVSPDYSEMHLGYFGYIDQSPSLPAFGDYTTATPLDELMDCGGDDFKAVALLARRTGAVNESDAPYEEVPGALAPLSRHLLHVYNFYNDKETRYQKANRENIKGALMRYGAVSAGVYASDPLTGNWSLSPYFNVATSATFIPAGNPDDLSVGDANHAVTLVGWDDSYSRENFNVLNRPSADGAWIVKNSWGASWGNDGYFYLSYEDAVLDTGAAYVGGPADSSERIYQYDPLGWVGSFSPVDGGSETGWFSNVFAVGSSAENEEIKAVSFYAGGVGNSYEIFVYGNVSGAPSSGGLIASQSGTLPLPGYHRVTLDPTAVVEAGTKFAVVVRLTTPGYTSPLAVEYPEGGYSDKAKANAGESFVSTDGQTWTDLTTLEPNANVCLKAFTSATTLPPAPLPPTPLPGGDSSGGCNLGFAPAALLLALPLLLRR